MCVCEDVRGRGVKLTGDKNSDPVSLQTVRPSPDFIIVLDGSASLPSCRV